MKTNLRELYTGLQTWFVAIVAIMGIASNAHAEALDSIPARHAMLAAQACQEGRYEDAEKAINQAIFNDEEKDLLYTWYVKGFVHKEIYKHRQADNPKSPQREKAVEAFLKAKHLAGDEADRYNNNSALRYLASTYYNDAITMASQFTLNNELEPEALLEQHIRLCTIIDAFTHEKAAFYKQKGMRYFDLWHQTPCDLALNEKAFTCFQLATELDANDGDSFYNAGVVRYSLVYMMLKDKPQHCELEIDEMAELQAVVQILLKGQTNFPEHEGISTALRNTYLILGETEKAESIHTDVEP
jgi:tetratricopeptide (TPR) repeat protein